MLTSAPADVATARIGPNAIVRTVEALRERVGRAGASELLGAAGLQRYDEISPEKMVAEDEVIALFRTMRDRLGPAGSDGVARLAGEKTAQYILANRIPKLAQSLMRVLPARLATATLLSSINKHTWTFAGSGVVGIESGSPPQIGIAGCPICRNCASETPVCSYYAACFERLFRSLVNAATVVEEIACEAEGARQCTFEIRC